MKRTLPEFESLSKGTKNYLALALCVILYFAFFASINKSVFFSGLRAMFMYEGATTTLDILYGIILVAGLLLLISRLVNLGQYKFTPGTLGIICLILIIYLPHRFNIIAGQNWHFLPFKFWTRLRYSDALVLLLIGIAFRLNKKSHYHAPETDLLLEDAEHKRSKQDIFVRKAYADKIAGLVMGKKTEHSFAIGITGKWGSGKSVFMEQIHDSLSEGIKIKFNPWLSKTPALITEDFFSLVVDHIKPYHKTLSGQIKDYSKSLLSVEDSLPVKFSKLIPGIDVGYVNLEEQRKQIKSTIDKNNLKVLIFIDDLDRLNGAEVMAVLSIIRNSFDFPNMFFFVAYDYDYLIKVMEKGEIQYPAHFLRKIFQFDIDLPAFPAFILKEKLIELLTHNKSDDQKQVIRQSIDEIDQHLKIWNFVANIRDCIRLANSFNHVFQAKFPEVDMTDFLLIEILKLYNQQQYHQIRELVFRNTHSTFIVEDPESQMLRFNQTNFLSDPKVDRSLIEFHHFLFNRQDEPGVKALRKIGNALRYFSDHLFGQISFLEFDRYKQADGFSGFREFINNSYGQQKQSELFELLLRVPLPSDPRQFANLVKGFVVYSNHAGNDTLLNRIYKVFQRIEYQELYGSLGYSWEFLDYLLEPIEFPYFYEFKIAYWVSFTGLFQETPENTAVREKVSERMLVLFERSLAESIKFNKRSLVLADMMLEMKIDSINEKVKSVFAQYVKDNAIAFAKSGLLIKLDENKLGFDTRINNLLGWDGFEQFLISIPEDKEVLMLKSIFYAFKQLRFDSIKYDARILTISSDQLTEFIHSESYPEFPPQKLSVVTKRLGKLSISNTITKLKDSFWISRALESTRVEAINGGKYLFRRTLQLDADENRLMRATLYFLVDDFLMLTVNNHRIDKKYDGFDGPHELNLTDFIVSGTNTFDFLIENITYDPNEVDRNEGANPYEFIYTLELEYEGDFVKIEESPLFWREANNV